MGDHMKARKFNKQIPSFSITAYIENFKLIIIK